MSSPQTGDPLDDPERERLFARLSAHAAADHIDLSELERRVAAVCAAENSAEARAVLADLPELPAGSGPTAGPAEAGFGRDTARAGAEAGRPRWGKGHADAERPADGWRATDERFRDPRTRRVMRVWEDAAGGRHYIADE